MLFRNTITSIMSLAAFLPMFGQSCPNAESQLPVIYTSETHTSTSTLSGAESSRGTSDVWKRHAYVKSNLPAWAMLWINGAGEIDIVPHLSVNLSVYYSGFNYFRSDIKFRTFSVMPELRFWPRVTNDGFFVAPHMGIGWYNVAFGGDHRYQDHNRSTPAFGGGVNLGYRFALPRNPRWKFEISLGAGIYNLDYDVFENRHNGLIIDRKSRMFYGIDNAAFSICYTFDINKKGGSE